DRQQQDDDKSHQGGGAALRVLLVLVAAARHTGRPRDGASAAVSLAAATSWVTPFEAMFTAAPPPTRQRVSKMAGRWPENSLRKPPIQDPSSGGVAAAAVAFSYFHPSRAFRKRRNGP